MMTLRFFGLMALAAASMYGQPAQYWSVSPPDCSALNQTPVVITGKGYSCYRTGTFLWLAAGAGWSTKIRVAGPASGAIGVDYLFYDANGTFQSMDINGSFVDSTDELNFALYDNQPSEIVLIGASSNAPHYNSTATGSVYVTFYCPDADTCLNVQPQLMYLALPSIPWALSVPITWDDQLSTTWSAVGVDNGGTKIVSFVVYNEDTIEHSFTIDVYDSDGFFYDRGFTPPILPLEDLGGGVLGEGGTYGDLLKNVVSIPPGPFKVIIDGGPAGVLSAVSVLQFDGPSGTSLQVAFDTPPSAALSAKGARKVSKRQQRMKPTSVPLFKTLPRKSGSK